MKSGAILLLLLFFVFVSYGAAAEPVKEKRTINKDLAIQNLLIGLDSDNTGLTSSSAFYLGELSSTEAVIPLMKMLRNSEREELRISAALALLKIGDARGIYAIKRAIVFDESKRVSDMCEKFYNSHLYDNHSLKY
ncbi:MAG: HEAT repeat domain-containing protein [Ignavibacteriaceae bacterium]